jgi:hypothetical protein
VLFAKEKGKTLLRLCLKRPLVRFVVEEARWRWLNPMSNALIAKELGSAREAGMFVPLAGGGE